MEIKIVLPKSTWAVLLRDGETSLTCFSLHIYSPGPWFELCTVRKKVNNGNDNIIREIKFDWPLIKISQTAFIAEINGEF